VYAHSYESTVNISINQEEVSSSEKITGVTQYDTGKVYARVTVTVGNGIYGMAMRQNPTLFADSIIGTVHASYDYDGYDSNWDWVDFTSSGTYYVKAKQFNSPGTSHWSAGVATLGVN